MCIKIFGHKLHIGTPYRGKYFFTRQIPTSCLSKSGGIISDVTKYQISAINSCWEKCDEKCAYMFNVYKTQLSQQTGSRNLKSDIWSQASYRYPISWEAFLDPSYSYFLFAEFVDFYTHLTYICICTFFVADGQTGQR
jgi:hypothetical protein